MSLLYNLMASKPHRAPRCLDLQAHGRDMAVYQKGIADPKSCQTSLFFLTFHLVWALCDSVWIWVPLPSTNSSLCWQEELNSHGCPPLPGALCATWGGMTKYLWTSWAWFIFNWQICSSHLKGWQKWALTPPKWKFPGNLTKLSRALPACTTCPAEVAALRLVSTIGHPGGEQVKLSMSVSTQVWTWIGPKVLALRLGVTQPSVGVSTSNGHPRRPPQPTGPGWVSSPPKSITQIRAGKSHPKSAYFSSMHWW